MPSPSTFSASTVSAIAMPGASATVGPRVQHVLAVEDDRAPARLRRLHADREERQRRLGEHVDREHEREQHDRGRDHVREDVAPEQPPVRGAEPDRRLDELAPPDRQDLASNRSRDVRDVDEADDRDRQQQAPGREVERPERDAARDQHGREADREQVDGERPDEVEEAREDAVDEAAEEAGDDADQHSEEARDQRGGRSDQERVAAAVEQAGGDVAALLVGAEEVVVDVPRRADRRDAEPEALRSTAPSRARACRSRSSCRRGSTGTGRCARRGARRAARRGRARR